MTAAMKTGTCLVVSGDRRLVEVPAGFDAIRVPAYDPTSYVEVIL
jgi:hypothetical protein